MTTADEPEPLKDADPGRITGYTSAEGRSGAGAAADPKVFVVRLPEGNNAFGWEIRRFGTFILSKAQRSFPTAEAAQAAGERVLASVRSERPSQS